MAEISNVLLIGNAGKGKSTLANVLTGTNEFEEFTNRIRGTDEAKAKEFEHEWIKYRVIDTVGIGDSIKSTGEILSKLEGKADIFSEGLNQILFVTNGRFTKEEVETFDLLSKAIFNDQVTDYTTIVCTNFWKFRDKEACERDHKAFREEIAKLSIPLASTTIIYVDNPPIEGHYESIAREPREASRKILLEHLKTCQEVYQPELLAKFSKMVEEFNSIIIDTDEAINNADLHFNNNVKYLGEFIPEREKIVKMIEEHREKVQGHMKDRFTTSTFSHAVVLTGKAVAISGIWFPPVALTGIVTSAIGLLGVACSESVAIINENNVYKLFEEILAKDKEKCETLENLQAKLKESIKSFENIRLRLEISEYRKLNIDRKRIEVIENVLNQILGEEVKTDMNLEKNEKIKHSTGLKAARASLETICKLVPSPLSFYCIYRDHKEIESRTSLNDMEKAIKIWNEELNVSKEKLLLLNNECEKIKWCKEEVTKLSKDI